MDLNETLQHHGVKGMRWGQRKQRVPAKALSKAINERRASSKREKSWTSSYRKRGSMSDAQLKKKVERLRLENEFNRLATEATAPQRKKVKMYLNTAGNMPVSSDKGKILKKALKGAAVAL